MLKHILGMMIGVNCLLVNYSLAQVCPDCQITPFRPLEPILQRPPRVNNQPTNPNWQPYNPPVVNQPPKTFAEDEKTTTGSNSSNDIGNCNCDNTKLDNLVVRVDHLAGLLDKTSCKCVTPEPVDLGPILSQLNELKIQLTALEQKQQEKPEPIVINVPETTTTTPVRQIIYLTGENLESCKKTDIEAEKLKQYKAVNLTTVVIRTREVTVVKDLPQLIILPEKKQVNGEWNVLNYFALLTRTETTPLAPVTK